MLTGTYLLFVAAVNEHAPVFSGTPYNTAVLENLVIGSSLIQVNATDADDGLDGLFMKKLKPQGVTFDVLFM